MYFLEMVNSNVKDDDYQGRFAEVSVALGDYAEITSGSAVEQLPCEMIIKKSHTLNKLDLPLLQEYLNEYLKRLRLNNSY